MRNFVKQRFGLLCLTVCIVNNDLAICGTVVSVCSAFDLFEDDGNRTDRHERVEQRVVFEIAREGVTNFRYFAFIVIGICLRDIISVSNMEAQTVFLISFSVLA